jgi:small subunit ribosomal protein S12
MPTLQQLIRIPRKKKRYKNKTPSLENCPQKKGICIKLILKAPKKPNSALRKIAHVKLSNNKKIFSYIPGEGHNLQEFSSVLVKGGKVKDLPGVKYHLIRNKFDLLSVLNRKTSRSKYGTKKIKKIL